MRIGIMLRHYDQHGGGVRVYTQRLLSALLQLRSGHEFVFFYRNPALLGTYAGYQEVEETALAAHDPEVGPVRCDPRHPAAPDRRVIQPEVLHSSASSLPLGLGLSWPRLVCDAVGIPVRRSSQPPLPGAALRRAAGAIIAVSEVTRAHVLQYLPVSADRVPVVYSGVDDVFRRPLDESRLAAVRAKYALPDRFLLYAGAIYPPKNFTRLVRAYARVGPALGIPLVIAGGENRFLSERELEEPPGTGHRRVGAMAGLGGAAGAGRLLHARGRAAAPLALRVLRPARARGDGGGVSVVTADRYGTKELAEGAALLVDPEDVESIAAGIRRVLDDTALRERLITAGKERSRHFTWDRCARETLAALERIAAGRPPGESVPRPLAAETSRP